MSASMCARWQWKLLLAATVATVGLSRPQELPANPILSVVDGGVANGNQLWTVSVAPDPDLFSETLEGLGGSLAVELDFAIADSQIVSVTKNEAVWTIDNPGFNPFNDEMIPDDDIVFGIAFNETNAYVSLLSEILTSSDPVEVVTIETMGEGVGTLSWGGNTITPGNASEYELARIAQAGLNFDGYLGSAMPGGEEGIAGDYNNSGQVEQGDLDLVLLNWGAATPPIPPNWSNDLPDGAIDQGELDGVLLNWGNTAALASAAVPEPSTWLLFCLGGLLLATKPLIQRRKFFARFCLIVVSLVLSVVAQTSFAEELTTRDGDGADSWIESNNPDQTKGFDDPFRMRVRSAGNIRKPYLRFDLTELSFDPADAGSVSLTVFGQTDDEVNANIVEVWGINDGALGDALNDWDEDFITFNTAPQAGDSGTTVGPDTTLLSRLVLPAVNDYNQNGQIDAGDATVWRDNLGRSGDPGLPGDGNTTGAMIVGDPGYGVPDGVVDEADYAVWANDYGQGNQPAETRFTYSENDPFTFETTPEFVDFLKADTNGLVSLILIYNRPSGSSLSIATKDDGIFDPPTLDVMQAVPAQSAAVPEPTTLGLALLSLLAMACLRKRWG